MYTEPSTAWSCSMSQSVNIPGRGADSKVWRSQVIPLLALSLLKQIQREQKGDRTCTVDVGMMIAGALAINNYTDIKNGGVDEPI